MTAGSQPFGYRLTQMIKAAAIHSGDKPSTIMGDRRRTWQETEDRIARLAGALRANGLNPGDRVAILALNSDRYFEAIFAIWWAGCEVVPVNTRWSATEVAYSMDDADVKGAFIDATFAALIGEVGNEYDGIHARFYLDDGDVPAGLLDFEAELAKQEPAEDVCPAGDALAGIFYTGGTTGFPKGVMLTQTNLWANSTCGVPDLEMDKDTRCLHVAPMFHAADFVQTMAATAMKGTHIFMAAFHPVHTFEIIAAEQVNTLIMVPTMIKMMIDLPHASTFDVSCLKRLYYGASPMQETVLRKAMTVFTKARFTQAYGQTELAPLATVLKPEAHVLEGELSRQLRACGRPVSIAEMGIMGEDGTLLGDYESGEIVVRGPHVMKGYLNKPEQTADTLKNGWLYTGDGGYRDENGFYYISDRLKDMIITGGENVFSTEVENAVASCPGVAGVSVIGVPNEEWGEAVHAIVIRAEGSEVSEQEIIDHARAQIAHYKCPSSVSFRTEPFPLSGANKVLKTELRKPFWDDKDKGVN